MTLSEIEAALRASLAASFTEESDMLKWADALKAERERIEPIIAWAEKASACPDCGEPFGSHANHCPQGKP